jgi:8-hydroxy-5-deazaflavin:NADPH oxidoreductase
MSPLTEIEMRIGFIGAGKNARTMARHMVSAGHQVILCNSRSPETLAETVADLGSSAAAGTRDDAIDTDLVILAVRWVDAKKAVAGIEWNGRILIDATNAHADSLPDLSPAGISRSRAALAGRTSSEILSEWVPGARLVKSISNMPMDWINDFSPNKPRTAIFTSGDDEEAKRVVIDLLNQVGFAGIDLGSLAKGGAMHDVGAPLSGVELHFVRRLR